MSRVPSPAPPAAKTLGAVIKEKDEELALFFEMRRRDRERRQEAGANPPSTGERADPIAGVRQETRVPVRKGAVEDFLNVDGEKNDYDWLLTPPGTPLFSTVQSESKRSPPSNMGTPKTRPTALKSRLANHTESLSKTTVTSRTASMANLATRRPSSSGGPTPALSRPATPPGRPAANKISRPSTPTSRPTIPSKAAPPQRSSTPSRVAATSVKSSAPPARSSTPTRSSTPSRSSAGPAAARSSAPLSRPSIPPESKPASRAATPTRRSSIATTQPASTAPTGRSSSVSKSAPALIRSSTQSQGNTPITKPKPWKPSEMPGFTLDAPPNLRTSAPERPTSASRGRPAAPSPRSSSVESGPAARQRRQSCSPSRGRAPNGTVPTGSSVPATRRSQTNSGASVNPVQIGNKMVERVVSMRRLVPPKQENQRLSQNSLSGKSSSSPDGAGFGRTLSKKSLDMALRHMDIRRSIPNNLRPLMTNVPASSVYSARSGSTRSRQVSATDSPMATSSNCSSEPSVNNNLIYFDGGELEDDLNSSERSSCNLPFGQAPR